MRKFLFADGLFSAVEDVNSFVVEKPKISADELDALLADVDARSDVTPSGDADEETPGDDADEETAGDEMHVEGTYRHHQCL